MVERVGAKTHLYQDQSSAAKKQKNTSSLENRVSVLAKKIRAMAATLESATPINERDVSTQVPKGTPKLPTPTRRKK